MSEAGDALATQQRAGEMCRIFSEFLAGFAEQTDGYMFLAAFNVAWLEMQRVIDAASDADKALLRQLILAIIGSFGRTVQ